MSSQYRMMTQRKESRMASVEKILAIDIKSNFINIIMFLWGTLYTTSIILNNLVLFPETYVIFTISSILDLSVLPYRQQWSTSHLKLTIEIMRNSQ